MHSMSSISLMRPRPPFRTRQRMAFTLVELILVMALLALILALAAPTLSRSLRQHKLEQEATRLLALTEYGRDEAVSQGVPMVVWIDSASGSFGVEAKTGYDGEEARNKEFSLDPEVHFEVKDAVVTQGGLVNAAEFSPDGTLDLSSVDSMRLIDRNNSAVALSQTEDRWGYEIVKEGQ